MNVPLKLRVSVDIEIPEHLKDVITIGDVKLRTRNENDEISDVPNIKIDELPRTRRGIATAEFKFCEECGETFKPNSNSQRYCSDRCKRIYNEKKTWNDVRPTES